MDVIRLEIVHQNGSRVAPYFVLPGLTVKSITPSSHASVLLRPYPSDPTLHFPKPYDQLFQLQKKNLQLLTTTASTDRMSVYQELFKNMTAQLQALLKSMSAQSESTHWELPVLKILAKNVYLVSRTIQQSQSQAMPQSQHNDTSALSDMEEHALSGRMEEAARLLSRCFTLSLTDRAPLPQSKKWGSIYIANLLFRIYFQLNHTRLCTNLIRALENPQLEFPALTAFPKAEWITFMYYRARIHIHANEFKKAEELLELAFQSCHRNAKKQQRQLLVYLITVKMLHGHLPTEPCLQKYQLTHAFSSLVLAVKRGELYRFQASLESNMKFFMHYELYLTLMIQLKHLVYRNLFKKIYAVAETGESNRLSLGTLLESTRIMKSMTLSSHDDHARQKSDSSNSSNSNSGHQNLLEPTLDLDELECIAANLICDGYIRGYLSHEKRLIVLSKKNPFPSPSSFL